MFHPNHSSSSRLLSALSEAVAARVEVDAQNECVIEFHGALEVVVSMAQDGRLLSLRTALTPAAHPLDPPLLEGALALNLTSMRPGFSVALDDGSGQLMLVMLVDADSTSRERFLSLVAGFLELAPQMRTEFAGPRAGIESPVIDMGVFA